MKRTFLMVLLLLTLGGCGPWLRTEGRYQSEPLNFSVELPSGWMRLNTSDILVITRDGVLLQQIWAQRLKLSEEKQFTGTKKRVDEEMLPQEVAEVVLDDYQSSQGLLDFRIEENAPVMLGGVPGFRARFAYKTQSGLQYRCLYYGAVSGGSVYSLCYQAPARHYFGKDLDTFEKAVKTFRLLKS